MSEYKLECNHTTRDIKDFGKCPNCDMHTLLNLHEVFKRKLDKSNRENEMMRECLEIIKEDKYEATPWLTVETGSAKRAKECLSKLSKENE
jgi:hypothetical protein